MIHPQFSNRMQSLTQSDIRRMTLECERLGGINLGQGVCDLPTIPELKRFLGEAVEANKSTYSRYDGIPELREAVSRRLSSAGMTYNPEDEIVITVGSTGAFAMAMMALLNQGDEVLIPEPFYGYHWNTILAAGGVPVPVALMGPSFDLDFHDLEAKMSERTKAIIVCSPANPSGKVWSRAELATLVPLLDRHDLWAVTDEIYEDIVYDDLQHVSLGSIPEARERTIVISGFSKTFSITGWRLGYAAAPARMAQALGILNDLYYVCAPTPLQHAVAKALAQVPPDYYASLRKDYQLKRDRLIETCTNLGWRPRIPGGAYYLMAEPGDLGTTARDISDTILHRGGVASVPGSAFYRDGAGESLIRFCFAKTFEDLEEACLRLEKTFG